MATLDDLLAQYEPNPDDIQKKSAAAFWTSLGAQLLQSHKGQGLAALGAGAVSGSNAAAATRDDLLKQSGMRLSQGLEILKMRQQMAAFDQAQALFRDDPATPNAQPDQGAGVSPRSAAQFGPASDPSPTMGGQFAPTGVAGDTTGFLPLPPAPSAPANAPGPNFNGQVPKFAGPRAAMAFALQGNSKAADVAQTAGQLQVNRMGIITQGNRVVGQRVENGFIQYNRDGTQQFVPDAPGAVEGAAAKAGAIQKAESTAKAQTELIPVPQGDGSTRLMPKSLALQQFGAPAQPFASPTSTTPPSITSPQFGMSAAPPDTAASPTPPETAAEAKLYKGTMPTYTPPVAQPGVSQSTASRLRDENVAALSKQVLEEINQRGSAALHGQGLSTMMEDLLAEVGKTGVTTPALVKAGQIAKAMGVDPDAVDSFLRSNSSPAETLAKITSVAAGQAVKQNISSNRPTQFEYSNMLGSTPNPGMQEQAWKGAIRVMHGTENAALAEMQAAHDWSDSHRGDMTAFPAWWAKNNPDTAFMPDKNELRRIYSTPASGLKSSSGPAANQPASVQLAPAAQGNKTAQFMIQQVLKDGDPKKIQRLRDLGYVQ